MHSLTPSFQAIATEENIDDWAKYRMCLLIFEFAILNMQCTFIVSLSKDIAECLKEIL